MPASLQCGSRERVRIACLPVPLHCITLHRKHNLLSLGLLGHTMEITQHSSRSISCPVRRRASERRDAVIPYVSQAPRTHRGRPVVRTPN
eukprot:1061464-Amphidinium_carterae.1